MHTLCANPLSSSNLNLHVPLHVTWLVPLKPLNWILHLVISPTKSLLHFAIKYEQQLSMVIQYESESMLAAPWWLCLVLSITVMHNISGPLLHFIWLGLDPYLLVSNMPCLTPIPVLCFPLCYLLHDPLLDLHGLAALVILCQVIDPLYLLEYKFPVIQKIYGNVG